MLKFAESKLLQKAHEHHHGQAFKTIRPTVITFSRRQGINGLAELDFFTNNRLRIKNYLTQGLNC